MRIVDVQVSFFSIPAVEPPFQWRAGLPGSEPAGTGALIRLITDDGLEGLVASNRGPIIADLIERRVRKELIGQDPLQREWLWHRMWELDRIEEFPLYFLGLIDIALWDLAAKQARLPVYKLLGGFRSSLPAYASTVTFNSIEEYLDVIDQSLELGYQGVKLHAWGDARRDARLSQAVRAHVGPDVPLMYDGSAGFDLPDAIYLGHALAEADYLWYEEPMREFSITAYKQLAQAVQVPLLVGETSDGAHMNIADYITSGCATFVRTSVHYKGGITGALRVAHLAEAFHLRAEVHGGGLVHRHLCMAIPNTTHYESFVGTNPVVREEVVDKQGLVHAPDTIGFGFEEQLDVLG